MKLNSLSFQACYIPQYTSILKMFKLKLGKIPVRYWTFLAILVLIGNIIFLIRFLTRYYIDENDFLYGISRDSKSNDGGLIDLPHFEYLISKSECHYESEIDAAPLFMIAINSHPLDKDMRQAIRDSWAHFHKSVQTLFFLGTVDSDQIQKDIVAEDKEYGDIVQGNFIDNQHNLSYKHVMMLKWFVENCSAAEYMIKMDDDVFANVPAIYDFLCANENPTNFLMGVYHEPERAPRNGTWSVNRHEYASDFYPAYAERNSIIYSGDVVSKLFATSNLVNFFWVEDVFVTGLLRSQINIDITSIQSYLLTKKSLDDMRDRSLHLPHPQNFMFSRPNLTIDDQLLLWERTEWYRIGEKTQL